MFNSSILDLVLTLGFIYFLLALIASTVLEIIHNILNQRGKQLYKSLRNLYLKDPKWQAFFEDQISKSPFIEPLKTLKLFSKTEERYPSYISAQNFSQSVLNILLKNPDVSTVNPNGNPTVNLKTITSHPLLPDEFKKTLETLWTQANGELKKFLENIEVFYDNACDRITGKFKRLTQFFLFIIGAVVVITLNVDTIFISQTLWKNKELLKNTADQIQSNLPKLEEMYKKTSGFAYKKDSTIQVLEDGIKADSLNAEDIKSIKDSLMKNDSSLKDSFKDIDTLYEQVKLQTELLSSISQIPMGYDSVNCFECHYMKEGKCVTRYNFLKILGWFITVLAIYLGAEFWFGLLNKIISLRGTGKRPEETKEEKEEEKSKK